MTKIFRRNPLRAKTKVCCNRASDKSQICNRNCFGQHGSHARKQRKVRLESEFVIWLLTNILLSHRFGNPHSRTIWAQLTFFAITESHLKGDKGVNGAKSKAGHRAGMTKKKTSKTIDTDDSTELSDLSASDCDEKADGSVENSDVGMVQDSDDDFDGAQLTEKQTKRVLHEEVKKKHYIIISFYSFPRSSYPKMFRPFSMMTLV